MKKRRRRGGSRKNRPRPTPKWLKTSSELESKGRERCLMVLSVLSGEKPVTDAIAEAGISRGTYYQLETRALNAMLRALGPDGATETSESSPRRQIAQLEERLKAEEQAKRRAQRLLLMTRKVMGPPRRTRSTKRGSGPSPRSKGRKKPAKDRTAPPSTPAPTGAGAP